MDACGYDERVAVLIEEHLPLVSRIAGSLKATLAARVELDELVAEGVLGLVRAARSWNPEHKSGATFATYAYRVVRGAMREWVRREMNRVGAEVGRQLEAGEEVARLMSLLSPEDAELLRLRFIENRSRAEIAKRYGVTIQRARSMQRAVLARAGRVARRRERDGGNGAAESA